MPSSPESFDVIACGLNVVDTMVVLPETVRRNEKHCVSHLLVQGGGPGPNQACGLAALGWRTAIVTRHGDNAPSRISESEFTRSGVSLELAIHAPAARPAMAMIEVDPRSGERTIFYNLDDYAWLTREDIPVAAVAAAKLVIVDAYEHIAALRLLELAREAGIPGVLDGETGDPAKMLALIALASDVILSREGGRHLTGRDDPGEILFALANQTRARLVITDGVQGAWALVDGGVIHQPAFPVEAIDTTGCGDSFHAAYASALLDGFHVAQRLEFAAWIAAQVARFLGPRSQLPTREWIRQADQSMLSPALREALGRGKTKNRK